MENSKKGSRSRGLKPSRVISDEIDAANFARLMPQEAKDLPSSIWPPETVKRPNVDAVLYPLPRIKTYKIAVYAQAHYVFTVEFKKKWHATLFHILLNKSRYHAGVRAH